MFDYNVSWCGFLWVYPLWSLLSLESVGFFRFLFFFFGQIWQIFNDPFFGCFSSPPPFLLLSGTRGVWVSHLPLSSPHVPKAPFICFPVCFLSAVQIGPFLSLRLRVHRSVPRPFLLPGQYAGFISGIVCFGSKISVWFCLSIFCLLWAPFLSLVSDVFVVAPWNVLWRLLKSFADSVICAISVLALWVIFLFSLEIFLVPAMGRNFFLFLNLDVLVIMRFQFSLNS